MTEPVISADLIDWTERQYVSQFSVTPLSLTINIAGAPADPDGNVVQAQLLLQNADGSSTPVTAYTAARENTGVYTVTTSSQDTATPADAALAWSYSISSAPQQYMSYLVIGKANPNYDGLPINIKDLIELVWIRFADCFDSPAGGPNLQTYYQAHWSRGRVAQLMQIALMNLNTISQPFSQYSLDGSTGPAFPTNLWGGLLGTYTYVQCLKQLIRSWTEQPNVVGAGSVTRLDRRDYTDRWRNVLKDEEAELKSQLDMFKIRHMGLGNPRVLVSGGVYGRYAPTRIAGSVAARPRMWARKPDGTERSCTVLQRGKVLSQSCLSRISSPMTCWPSLSSRGRGSPGFARPTAGTTRWCRSARTTGTRPPAGAVTRGT